ncbi:sensor histidine kinase [Mycobacterium sp. DL592]|uniref:sensor histidine kinase n=1 Tax=Mycobacterium sp. DL592 TaxID=2675524 RepID=UPI001FBA72AF|nr:histidine kinase [Mycobacterium sp. DL592]
MPVFLGLSVFPSRFHVSWSYALLSMCAAVCFVAGWRWPTLASLTISALAVPLFAAEAWGLSGLVPYLGAVALADVVARSAGTLPIVATTAAWSAAVVGGYALDDYTSLRSAATAVTATAVVAVPVLAGLYLRAQRRLAAMYRQRAEYAELQRAASESVVRSQERTAMARELHDVVAHHMSSIALRIAVAQHTIDDLTPDTTAVLADVHTTASAALADIRRLNDALRDPQLREVAMIEADTLWTEIDAAVARAVAAGLSVRTCIDRGAGGLDVMSRLTLLRVTQEALTNAMKYGAGPDPVELSLDSRDDGVAIRVSNTCASPEPPAGTGHGIIGMTERLHLVGGRFDARRVDRRWVLDAWIPQRITGAGDVR